MAKLRIVLAIGLMFGLIETAQSVETLFSAGFKTSEGYSTGLWLPGSEPMRTPASRAGTGRLTTQVTCIRTRRRSAPTGPTPASAA